MNVILGIATIAIGLAYSGLGILGVVEVVQLRAERGVSRFGLGFSLMAASCGPHHLLHGWATLQGADHGGPLAVATIVGLPAGLIFVLLRVEAMFGGRADRFVSGIPRWLPAIPVLFLVAAGGLVAWSVASAASSGRSGAGHHAGAVDIGSTVFVTNVFVTVTYSMVGWCLFRTQLRRYAAAGGWSVSGLALSGVFPTCALMHLVYAVSVPASDHSSFFDMVGVPASVYFLWVVYGVYRDSFVDWNRRPLVGSASQPIRPSPWEPAPRPA